MQEACTIRHDTPARQQATTAAAALAAWCEDNVTTPRQLALEAGLSQGAVARVIRGERRLGAHAARKLAAVTGLDDALLHDQRARSYGPLADTLRDWCRQHDISGAELGRRVGRSEGFKRILTGQVAYPAPALLDRLEDVTGLDLSAHRVRPDHVTTLADARAAVVRELGETHEVVRDLDRFARGLQRPLATVPALRAAIEPELAGDDAHRRFGIKIPYDKRRGKPNTKRWANFRRNLHRALEVLGTAEPARPSWHLSPAWQELAALAKSDGKAAWAGISRLARVADAAGLAPSDISDRAVDLLARDLHEDPRRFARRDADNREVVRNTVKRWNALAERFAGRGWPQVRLSPLPHAGWRFETATDALSPALHAAIDAYVVAATRPRATTGSSRYREQAAADIDPVKPATAEGHRRALLTAAKTLVDAGHCEMSELTAIEQIVNPEAATIVLEALEDRHSEADGPNTLDREQSAYAETLAQRLHSVARRLGTVSERGLRDLKGLAKKARGAERTTGVTRVNLERLRQFDEARIRQFVNLHTTILHEAQRARRRGSMDADLAKRNMEGVALLLLRICPMRRANLGGLRWSRHFTPPGLHGPDGWLVIPSHETKHHRPIERKISRERWQWLERYMTEAQPLLRMPDDVANDHLFPSPVHPRRHIGLDHLSQVVAGVVRARLDVDMHLHLIRHLYAWIILRRDRTALATVSRILDHTNPGVTEDFYAAFDTELCVEDADRMLDETAQGEPA